MQNASKKLYDLEQAVQEAAGKLHKKLNTLLDHLTDTALPHMTLPQWLQLAQAVKSILKVIIQWTRHVRMPLLITFLCVFGVCGCVCDANRSCKSLKAFPRKPDLSSRADQ